MVLYRFVTDSVADKPAAGLGNGGKHKGNHVYLLIYYLFLNHWHRRHLKREGYNVGPDMSKDPRVPSIGVHSGTHYQLNSN